MNSEEIEQLYPKGESITVTISKVENFGAFADLEKGITGYIPTKELSWTGSVLDAREKLEPNQHVLAKIISIDPRHQSITLSPKSARENPWYHFAKTHQQNDIVKGRVIRVQEKAAFLELDGDVEGIIPLSHAWLKVEKMEDALLVNDNVQTKILYLDEKEKVAVLSVTGLYKDEKNYTESESTWTLYDEFPNLFDMLKYQNEKETERKTAIAVNSYKKIKNILVINSDPNLNLSVALMLEGFEFQIFEATSSEKAFAALEKNAVDLIIADLNSHPGEIISFLKDIKKRFSKIEIILQVTLQTVQEKLNDIFQLGLQNHLLVKPWKIEKLIEMINFAAEGRFPQSEILDPRLNDHNFINKISESFIGRIENRVDIASILEEVKTTTGASFAIIFQQHLTTLETSVFYASGLAQMPNFRELDLLRFSPIKEVIRDKITLFDTHARGLRYSNLEPLGNFSSIIGQRLEFSSEYGYGLFLFGKKPNQFHADCLDEVKTAARILGVAVERNRLEDIYKTQHRLVVAGQLSSALIHELKNEQQALFNYVEILKTDSLNLNSGKIDGNDVQFLARFQQVVNHLIEGQNKIQAIYYLFLNLLKDKDEEKINVSDHLKKLTLIIQPIADKSHVQIDTPAQSSCECTINTSRFDQIITNLLINALEQIPLVRQKTGKIVITARIDHSCELPIQIEIQDNGPGIHTVHVNQVFDIFFTTKKNGSGLGLYISKALTESLGGKISVKETVKFEGTTFLIELPLNTPQEGKDNGK